MTEEDNSYVPVGTFEAIASGNESRFKVGETEWVAIGVNYVKGVNVADTIDVLEGQAFSKVLGPIDLLYHA